MSIQIKDLRRFLLFFRYQKEHFKLKKTQHYKARYGIEVPPYFDYYKKGGSIEIARQIKQDKTQEFANANSIRKSSTKTDVNFQTFPGKNEDIVYESLLVPMPTYVEVGYRISTTNERASRPVHDRDGSPECFQD